MLSALKMVRLIQHAKFPAIIPMRSPENAWKPQIWPVSLSQCDTKIRKINRPWPKTNQFWRWSGYINMPNFRSFFPLRSQENSQKPQIWPVWPRMAAVPSHRCAILARANRQKESSACRRKGSRCSLVFICVFVINSFMMSMPMLNLYQPKPC